MTIQGGQIYDILRTYNKQVKYSRTASSGSSGEKSLDKVAISPEAKKMSFISDILAQTGGNKKTVGELENLIKDTDFSKMSDKEISQLKSDILSKLL